MSRRPTPIHPLPEAVRSERYDVKSGRGSADNTNHVLHVPLDDSPKSLRIRAHEIAHALLSPERPDAPEGIDMRAIQRAEDLRMNVHTDKTAARKVLAAPLIDGSVDLDRFVGNRLEAFTSVLSLVHTGDEAKFLEALYRVDPDLSEEVAEFGERAWDAMYAKDETTWEDALRLALAAMEAANPPPPEEAEGDGGEQGEHGDAEQEGGAGAGDGGQQDGPSSDSDAEDDEDEQEGGAGGGSSDEPRKDEPRKDEDDAQGDAGDDEQDGPDGEEDADDEKDDEQNDEDGDEKGLADFLKRALPGGRRRRVTLAPPVADEPAKVEEVPADDPDVEQAVQGMIETMRWQGRTPSAAMTIERPPRPKRLPKGIVGRTRRADTSGAGLRHPNRWATDKALFESRGKKIGGGSILIDTSGSMHLDAEDVRRIVELAPAATIAAYSGPIGASSGTLRIIAQDGRRARDDELNPDGVGNMVDEPAVAWLAKQSKPRLWVCDGYVTGIRDEGSALVAERCAETCRRADILRLHDVESLEEWLVESRKGRRKVKTTREGVYK